VDALDRAYGQQPEVYPWLRLPEVFDMPLELAASVESAPALLFGARRLLAQLQVWLRARQRGVLALELVWNLDPRRANTRHVDAHHTGGQQGRLEWRTAQATQDMAHLQRILGEQLARVTLPAPVLTLRLRSVQTQPLAGESRSLLPDDVRKGDSLHQTLERLGARLGPGQVQCVSPHADHRPERMQQWAPWKASGTAQFAPKKGATNLISERATAQNSAEVHPQAGVWPTWLLPSPQRLPVHGNCPQYQGALTLLVGPQRLEAGWLDGAPVLRDYYIARSPQAGLVWVYRERLGGGAAEVGWDLSWYLHGLYG
jgi:protein ImuB